MQKGTKTRFGNNTIKLISSDPAEEVCKRISEWGEIDRIYINEKTEIEDNKGVIIRIYEFTLK